MTTFTPPPAAEEANISVDDAQMVHVRGEWHLLKDLESGRTQIGHPSDWYKTITFSPQAWQAIWQGRR